MNFKNRRLLVDERNKLVFKCRHRENSNYPDGEPLKLQSLNNRKANDKDVLETNRDQLDNRYHRDKER